MVRPMPDSGPQAVLSEISAATPVRDSSQARLPLLAFVADDETETALRGGLLNTVEGIEIRRGTILHATKYLAKEPTPRTLIVDISGVVNPVYELDNLAHVCAPDVTVLVIGEYDDLGLYRHLVREAGVVEYVHKPLTRDRVIRLFVPQIAGVTTDASAARGGSVIAVSGARGGVGTTTVAVNLALQLSAATRGHVVLLDLHLQQGTTALMLGVKSVGGLRIALEQPERADALFLDRVCVEVNERLRLIAAEESLDQPPLPTPDGVRRVLDLLSRRFNYIVIDLPAPSTFAEIQALRAARHFMVVMAPDLVSIRDADRLRQLAAGLGHSQTSIVLNRSGMQGGLKLTMIEQGLGDKPAFQIPDLGKQLGRAANLGKPALAECASFERAMAVLAQEVSGTAASRMSHGDRSLLSRMLGR
jgi:pilus assembly protein CpaE